MELNKVFKNLKHFLLEDTCDSPKCLAQRLNRLMHFSLYLSEKELEIYSQIQEEEKDLDIEKEARALILKGFHYNEREKILILKGSEKYRELRALNDKIMIIKKELRELVIMLRYEVELMKMDMRLSGQGHFDD